MPDRPDLEELYDGVEQIVGAFRQIAELGSRYFGSQRTRPPDGEGVTQSMDDLLPPVPLPETDDFGAPLSQMGDVELFVQPDAFEGADERFAMAAPPPLGEPPAVEEAEESGDPLDIGDRDPFQGFPPLPEPGQAPPDDVPLPEVEGLFPEGEEFLPPEAPVLDQPPDPWLRRMVMAMQQRDEQQRIVIEQHEDWLQQDASRYREIEAGQVRHRE